jgi:hypothetical protein
MDSNLNRNCSSGADSWGVCPSYNANRIASRIDNSAYSATYAGSGYADFGREKGDNAMACPDR